jgi:hypothetical protein
MRFNCKNYIEFSRDVKLTTTALDADRIFADGTRCSKGLRNRLIKKIKI